MDTRQYIYISPLGILEIKTENTALAELRITNRSADNETFSADKPCINSPQTKENNLPQHIRLIKAWLDEYFSGKEPDVPLELTPHGTEFQLRVWESLREIPYGTTVTYGDIAKRLNRQCPTRRTSARAVGQAVGRNPIGIIIPCHRVIGRGNKLTGFNAGIDAKISLLNIENIDTTKLKR